MLKSYVNSLRCHFSHIQPSEVQSVSFEVMVDCEIQTLKVNGLWIKIKAQSVCQPSITLTYF